MSTEYKMTKIKRDEFGTCTASTEKIVSEEFVKNFTDKNTLEFFIGLGGEEVVSRTSAGVIRSLSVSPDQSVRIQTTFTPIKES